MKAIFINTKDLKRFTNIDGNLDNDKLIQWVEVAQDVHIHQFLGTDLYDKIQSIIIAGTVDDVANANYKTLLETYIKPAHVRWAMVEYLPFASYNIARGGVYKHSSEASDSISIEEMNNLIAKSRETAQHYTDILIRYLCNNNTLFPEYSTNSDGDLYPEHDLNLGGWVL